MTSKEYNNKKRECWEEFWGEISGNIDFTPGVDDRMKEYIYDTFDRAYALGKLQASCGQVKEEISQEKTASQNQWIRVEDGLPEDRQRILFCYQSFYKGRYLTLYSTEIYYADVGFASGVIKQNLVLAWMPVAEFEIK